MTWLQFAASLIDSTVWPIATLAMVFAFRKGLRERIATMTRVQWGDKSVDFDRQLDKIENDAVQVLPGPNALQIEDQRNDADEKDDQSSFQSILDVNPRLAVITAWLPVEEQLQKIGRDRGYDARTRSASFLIRRLADDGIIDRATLSIIEELRHLRNDVLHRSNDSEISINDARRFRDLAELVVVKLQEKT